MALIKADRVKETSTSTGATTFALAGAVVGFRAFSSVCSVGDTFYYVIDSDSGSEWETGLGTYSAANTLTRTTVYASSNSGSIVTFSAGTKNVYISLTGRQIDTVSASPSASTGTPPSLINVAGAAHTALTASTEYNDIYWNLARTVQFSTGAIATQRAVRISQPTYSFVGASTITDSATVQIDGAPVAGTNATITNRIALKVLTGHLTAKGIVIQAAASQVLNLIEWTNSVGDVWGRISGDGVVYSTWRGTGNTIFNTNTPSLVTASAFGNTLVGSNSGVSITTANATVAVGHNACQNVTTGYYNVGYGFNALLNVTTGGNNIGIGTSAGGNATTAQDNVYIGFDAGRYLTNGSTANTSPTNSIYIGSFSKALSSTESNAIVIGNNGQSKGSGTTVIGTTSTTSTDIYGTLNTNGPVNIAPSALSSGWVASQTVTAPAHTALTASTEYNDIYWNLARTVQFSTGALTTQRAVRIAAPTYSFVAASTITTAATVQIDGAPVAGTNATITNQIAMRVLAGVAAAKGIVVQGATSQTGNLQEWQDSTGTVLSSVKSGGSLDIGQAVSSSGTPTPLIRATGAAHTGVGSGEYNDVSLNLSRTIALSSTFPYQRAVKITPPTYSGTVNVPGGLFTVHITGAPSGVTVVNDMRSALCVTASASLSDLAARGIVIESMTDANWLQTGNLLECIKRGNTGSLFAISGNGCITTTPFGKTGTQTPAFTITGPAHTSLTASTEYNDVYWNLARTVQFATGAIATQRAVRISQPTYSFVGASTITNAATVQIDGAPVAGTNATITNPIALRVLTGQAAGEGIVVQGAASQTANLQEWQDSAGNILASIGANGSPQYPSSNPSGYTANQNDLVLTGSAFQRLSGTAARDITGVAPPTGLSHVDGRTLRIFNVGSFSLTLKHNSASSTAANRFYCSGAVDIVIAAGDYAELIYDSNNNGSSAAGWRVY